MLRTLSLAHSRGFLSSVTVARAKLLYTPQPETPKPIYAGSLMEWGAYRDAWERRDKYWYWASLKRYVTFVFSSYKGGSGLLLEMRLFFTIKCPISQLRIKLMFTWYHQQQQQCVCSSSDLSWQCDCDLEFTLPCSGCSTCRAVVPSLPSTPLPLPPTNGNKKWYQYLVPAIRKNSPLQQEKQSSRLQDMQPDGQYLHSGRNQCRGDLKVESSAVQNIGLCRISDLDPVSPDIQCFSHYPVSGLIVRLSDRISSTLFAFHILYIVIIVFSYYFSKNPLLFSSSFKTFLPLHMANLQRK